MHMESHPLCPVIVALWWIVHPTFSSPYEELFTSKWKADYRRQYAPEQRKKQEAGHDSEGCWKLILGFFFAGCE